MASSVQVCEMDPVLKEKLRKFRFRKETNSAGLLIKVDMNSQMLILEEEYEDITLEEIQDELPASQPRFLVYSYCHEHGDGRKSYPLCFVFISPAGCKPEQQMAYAGSKLSLVSEAGLTKVFEVRNPEDLTDDWLKEKMQFFR